MKNIVQIGSGIAIGVVAGILAAPKSGKETRREIKNKIDTLQKDIEKLSGDAKIKVEKKINSLKSHLNDLNLNLS